MARRLASLAALITLALPAAAQAGQTIPLSAKGGSPRIAVDGAGNGHFVWNEGPGINDGASDRDVLHYCRIPAGGSACTVRHEFAGASRGQPFVFASGTSTILIVKRSAAAPGNTVRDTVLIRSDDSGQTFGAPSKIAEDTDSVVSGRDVAFFDGAASPLAVLHGNPEACEGSGDPSCPNQYGWFFQQPDGGASRARLFPFPSSRLMTGAVEFAGNADSTVAVVGDTEGLSMRLRTGGAANDPGSWSAASAVGQGTKPDLAREGADTYLLATQNVDGIRARWVLRRLEGGAFSAPVPLTEPEVDYGADIESGGGLHFAWFDRVVRYRHRASGADFGAPTVVACDSSALGPQVAGTGSGQGFVAWNGTDGTQYRTSAATLEPVTCGGGGSAGPAMSVLATTLRFRNGRSLLRMRCPAAAGRCRGTATISGTVPSGRLVPAAKRVLAKGKFSIAGGARGSATVKLTSAGATLLRRRSSASARAAIVAKDSAGNRRTTKKTLTLRRG